MHAQPSKNHPVVCIATDKLLPSAPTPQQALRCPCCDEVWHFQVPKALHELLGREAPDVGIEAAGCHYSKSMLHKVTWHPHQTCT